MKTIALGAIVVLFVISLVIPHQTASASAVSGPSASGTYRFVLEDEFLKSVEFSAQQDGGTTTGQMTFRDEAGEGEQEEDGGGGGHEETPVAFTMTASLNSLTIEDNRAVMNGTITASSNERYIGRFVQLVVEDNGDGTERADRLSWCLCKPEEGGWIPSDADLREDDGAFWSWWATDAEVREDVGIQSESVIPGNDTSCKVFRLSAYDFAEVTTGEGQIVVQP